MTLSINPYFLRYVVPTLYKTEINYPFMVLMKVIIYQNFQNVQIKYELNIFLESTKKSLYINARRPAEKQNKHHTAPYFTI